MDQKLLSLIRAAAWVALGGALGVMIPLAPSEAVGPAATPVDAPAAAPPSAAAASSAADPAQGLADPCLAVRAVDRRADELEAAIGAARDRFSRRYGVPVFAPSGFDPDAAERHWAAQIEGYPDHVWSAVDCTLYPCTALVLADRPRHTPEIPALAREVLGLEHAWVRAETHIEGMKSFDLVTVVLTDAPSDQAQSAWFHSLKTRARDQHTTEIRAAARSALVAP